MKLLSRFMLYRLFSALVVLVVAVCLWQCHFDGHPRSYGWPAFWYGATSPSRLFSAFRVETAPDNGTLNFSGRRPPLKLHERDPVYFLSLIVGLGSIAFTLWATWRLLAYWIPRLVRERRFSLKLMLAATTLTAVTVALLPVRPWHDDFKQARERQVDGGTVYVGLDPTSTWSPWWRRGPVVLGVFASLALFSELLARLGVFLGGLVAARLTHDRVDGMQGGEGMPPD